KLRALLEQVEKTAEPACLERNHHQDFSSYESRFSLSQKKFQKISTFSGAIIVQGLCQAEAEQSALITHRLSLSTSELFLHFRILSRFSEKKALQVTGKGKAEWQRGK